MYQISVPIWNGDLKAKDRDRTLAELKRLDAKRVFLALGTYEDDLEKRRTAMAELADNCRFFKAAGLEVGAWIWTFWLKDNQKFRPMRTIDGKEISEFMCPTDETFVAYAKDYIKEIAATGLDLIQFDDDFRYGFLPGGHACLCDGHIAAINQITGQTHSREELQRFIENGGPNPQRSAWLKVNGDAFRNFAKEMRAGVDEIDPTIRMGACACLSSWDLDGISAGELAKILAGNTRPFVRLIGAPYWGYRRSWGVRLQDVIEQERLEAAWTREGELEIISEGDAFPRPRSSCPASYLEGFDTALRAAGCTDGILKYGMDYVSNADYETGYAVFHQRNKSLYAKIDEIFGDKASVGVRIYEAPAKIEQMVMPTKVNQEVDIGHLYFSKAARSFAHNTIPAVYEGEGVCGAVFDESARHLPAEALKKGLILDLAAAEILQERGIDTGIAAIGERLTPEQEHFRKDHNHILTKGDTVSRLQLKPGAEVLSDCTVDEEQVPVSYRYENEAGQRFFVLNVHTRPRDVHLLKHYARSRQYAEQAEWLSGEKLPAYVYGHPALYIQCKEKDGALSVGLWNFFEDIAIDPVVELAKEYQEICFISGQGRLEGSKVYLEEIPAFGFFGFQVK